MAIFQYFMYSLRIVGLVTIDHTDLADLVDFGLIDMTLSRTFGTLEGSEIPLVCKSGDL